VTDRLIPEILHDRDTGTEDAWWRSRMADHVVRDDFGQDGEQDAQDAADRERIWRLPKVERALLRLAAAARACVHTSPPHEAHAALAAVLTEVGESTDG
jgi:hypothetical protein